MTPVGGDPRVAGAPTAGPTRSPSVRHRLTARTRLTLTFLALILAACAVTLLVVYLFMRFVPDYEFGTHTDGPQVGVTTAAQPSDPASSSGRPVVGTARAAVLTVDSRAGVLRVLAWVSSIVLVVLLVVGGLIGWATAGRTLRPLREINAAAALAAAGEFDQRTAIAGPPDEITRLSATFDAMLRRISEAFDQHRRFAANASHELQSPLSTTQALLDVAAARPDEVDVPVLLRKLRETNRRSIDTVDALLDLADITRDSLEYSAVSVSDVLDTVAADLAPLRSRRGIALDIAPGTACLIADARLVRQLLHNVLTNAIVHNVDGGWVRVRTDPAGQDRICIVVDNSGPPVRDADRLVEPFHRSQPRTRSPGARDGHGLGLAIVHAIVAAHGGELAVTALAAGGLQVAITMPVDAPHAPP